LKARLKTIGVAEYRFQMEVSAGRETGTDWRIVDVGGSRSQRQTWVPFFDDVDAIIFLAPISGFDQVLTEDRTVNRLEDSVLLWKALCANKIPHSYSPLKLPAPFSLTLQHPVRPHPDQVYLLIQGRKASRRMARYVKSYGSRDNTLDKSLEFLTIRICFT